MFESFLNPGFLAAGAALVSLPIIIHLINRMRFRRVRWAAMEFLLKSQKRNRRRLILEQLLLLALRCLLILLVVVLVSRYLGFSFAFLQPQNTLHVVLVDDTLSTSDHWIEDGQPRDSFRLGKDLIVKEIARNAAQARTTQRLVLILLSEPGTIRFDQRLNDQSIQELQTALADLQPTALRIELASGVEAAKAIFDGSPQDRHVLHVVSDFRQRDWAEPDGAALTRAVATVARDGARVNLVDISHPFRTEVLKTPLYHDNLAVVDLRPETRISPKDTPVQFTVTVANHGASERKNVRVNVKVNGIDRLEASVTTNVPAGGTRTEIFQVALDQLGFNQVTANLENEDVGLNGDNTRYAVVDVRKQVPVLIVDGDPATGLKERGDTFHVQTLLTAAKGFQVFPRAVNELEQANLEQYAAIYLLNVRDFSDKAQRNLENYVREGGSVAFFLGPRVNPDFYSKKLYADGKGIFPAPLADRPNPPLSEPEADPNLFDQQLKIFVRDESNPIFADVWQPKVRSIFSFLPIRRYYPVNRRAWNRDPGRVHELVTLPNQRAVRDYAAQAQELLDAIRQAAEDPKNARYRPALDRHQRTVQNTLVGDKPLYELANALEAMLKDRGEPDDPDKPNLVALWNQPELQRLRARVEQFRETVQLGDPLVITSTFGKGRVVAFLTTAGLAWNGWAGSSIASPTYPVVMLELQKYLTSGQGETSLTVGAPLEIQLDSVRYDTKMHRYFVPEQRDAGTAQAAGTPATTGPVDLKEQIGQTTSGRVRFAFNEARRPGMYLFEFSRLADENNPGAAQRIEQRAYVFNVDPAESELKRAPQDELERVANGVRVLKPNSGWGAELANRQSDLSESVWFYLIILLVLMAEQALAVRLSYHVGGGEPVPAAGVVRPGASAA